MTERVRTPGGGIWVPPMIWEAITSTAASHPETCVCVVCRAAGGDASAAETVVRKAMSI